MKSLLSAIVFLIFVELDGFSQISQGGIPYSIKNEEKFLKASTKGRVGSFSFMTIDNESESRRAEKIMAECKTCKKEYYGSGIDTKIDLVKDGTFYDLGNEGRVWLTKISSLTAFGMQFYFSKYKLPLGAKLFIYNEDKSMILGAFTSENNFEDGKFATQIIAGEAVTIEYFEPFGTQFSGALEIYKVIHVFKNSSLTGATNRTNHYGYSGNCNIDINCPEGANYQDVKRAVCRISTFDPGAGLTAWCSGAVINTTSTSRQYLILTANHCVEKNTTSPLERVSEWIFEFDYEVSDCSNKVDPVIQRNIKTLSGATIISKGRLSDYALLDLGKPIPASYGVTYLGWDISPTRIPSSVFGIHHPSGDVKKISFAGTPELVQTTNDGSYELPGPPYNKWKIRWTNGVTEGGSSGSPLFNQNKQLIGQLEGGTSQCASSTRTAKNGPDYYGTFAISWLNPDPGYAPLYSLLDPINSGVVSLPTFDPSPSIEAKFSTTTDFANSLKLNFINESTPDSELTSWRWNFGDGSPTSTEKNPLHIFPYAGTFTVSLTVNRGAQQNIAQKQITVYAGSLNPEFTASAVTGLAPLTVNFANSTANVTSWTWTISSSTGSSSGYTYVSGNANAQNIGVRFDFAGTYIVKLSISNGINTRTSEKSIVVTSSSTPVVDFTWQGPVYENNPVFFKNLTRYACSGIPSNRWTFSDFLGGTSNASSPLYNFSTAGTYAVSLCITDDCGQVNLCKTKLVKVLKPVNNLIPFFLVDNPTIKKGQTIKFFDRTQPPSDIKWWTWWFEQPKDLTSENPVQDNQSVLFLSPQPEGVSHTYNTSGTYKVRLYVGTGLTSGNYPVPSDAGVYYEQLVFVNETPEPVPGFTKQENQTVVVNGGAAGVKMIDLVQSENRYAVLKDQNGVNGAMPKSIINIYTKFAEDDWRLSGGYQTPTSGSLANSMIKDIALKKNNLMMRMDNGRYQMMTGTTTPIQLPLLSGVAFADSPQFDVYENEAVIVQNELAGRYLYLLTKTGATWGSAILAKYKISDGGFTGKVFIDQFAIIVQEGSDINIYERLNGNWDFSTKKTIRSKSLEPFRDFSYSENAIIVAGRSSSCPSLNVPIAYIYERPANGWVDNLDPTADLLLDVDSDISESTKICLDNVVPTSFTPNFVNISGNYAVVKVNLVNGANLVTRAYVYKKFDGFWRNTNDTYKLNNGERGLPTVTSNTDLVNGFSNATPGGKVEVYSYKNYCLLPPFDQTSNSISGIQQEVTRGIIRLGGAGGVVINSGAKITYVATGITLRPGFTAKEGSTAKFKAVATCDDLYFR